VRRLFPLLVFLALSCNTASAQDDFLTREEVDAVRDAQEPEKRIALYLEIAEMRLAGTRAALGSTKSGAGRAAQKNLVQYIKILEAMETTILEARESRSPFPKAMKLLETRLPETRRFLESLDNDASPLYADYRFTLEEAIAVTEELTEEIARGMFPEVDERQAPKEFPAAPPRPERTERNDSRESPKPPAEEGPPRKSNRP